MFDGLLLLSTEIPEFQYSEMFWKSLPVLSSFLLKTCGRNLKGLLEVVKGVWVKNKTAVPDGIYSVSIKILR